MLYMVICLDMPMIYNPLLFWPPFFQYPPMMVSPQSPGQNREYALTPEKDDSIIGKFGIYLYIYII